MKYIVSTMALVSLAVFGCTGSDSDTSSTTGSLESCFTTSGGQTRCVSTPGGITKGARDVDGDGSPDTFVCSNNEAGSHCDCARLGCRDMRQRPEGTGGLQGTSDGGRAFGDGGQTPDHRGGGRAGTGSSEGDMICPPTTGSGGSGAAGTGAAGAGGATGAAGATGAGGATIS